MAPMSLESLDPNDPRPPYVQVASVLRAAILTGKFAPGEQLPSGPQLAKRYGVARMTIQSALRILRDEGLVISRQGSGVFVRERTERPVGLRPHVERAFEAANVTIDFAGFTGETLQGALQEPLDKIRSGRLTPESITVRILIPDLALPMGLPVPVDDLSDSPDLRARSRRIVERSIHGIGDALEELESLELVKTARSEVRVYGGVPLFKLYVLNGSEAFFGFYPVVRHEVTISGTKHEIFDPMGKDSILFHHAVSSEPDSTDTQYVEQARLWFESMWGTVGRLAEA
jgi:DNA-binding transcriptional regulator YhcF (GntR family)